MTYHASRNSSRVFPAVTVFALGAVAGWGLSHVSSTPSWISPIVDRGHEPGRELVDNVAKYLRETRDAIEEKDSERALTMLAASVDGYGRLSTEDRSGLTRAVEMVGSQLMPDLKAEILRSPNDTGLFDCYRALCLEFRIPLDPEIVKAMTRVALSEAQNYLAESEPALVLSKLDEALKYATQAGIDVTKEAKSIRSQLMKSNPEFAKEFTVVDKIISDLHKADSQLKTATAQEVKKLLEETLQAKLGRDNYHVRNSLSAVMLRLDRSTGSEVVSETERSALRPIIKSVERHVLSAFHEGGIEERDKLTLERLKRFLEAKKP